jgi:hypothetical protein
MPWRHDDYVDGETNAERDDRVAMAISACMSCACYIQCSIFREANAKADLDSRVFGVIAGVWVRGE